MSWLYRLLGLPGEDLRVTTADGGVRLLVGNPHGRPDDILVRDGDTLQVCPLSELEAESSSSAAWLEGYVSGYRVDVVDLWNDPSAHDTYIGELANQVESSCRLMSMTSKWVDPHDAETPLNLRKSPFEGRKLDEYLPQELVGHFLACSQLGWWLKFEWHFALEAAVSEASDVDSAWRVYDVVLDRGAVLAGCLAALGEPEQADQVVKAVNSLATNHDRQILEVDYPTGYSAERMLPRDAVRPFRLSRSPFVPDIELAGMNQRISSVIPGGHLSAWWIRGYLAGREPTTRQLEDIWEVRVTFRLWRLAVLYHHISCAGNLALAQDELWSAAERYGGPDEAGS